MSLSQTTANFPSSRPDWMPPEWYAFFMALFSRTGGPGSPIDILTLQKQDEISQDVPPQNAATMAALQGVNDLWAEQRAPENLSEIRSRLDALESAEFPRVDLSDIRRKLDEIEAMLADFRLPTSPVLEQWNAPTLTNSWLNYGTPFNPTGYWRDPNGVVHLRGVIKSGTIGSSALTLPAGYRPANSEIFVAISNGAIGRAVVDASGGVTPDIGSNVYFSLDGMTFRAA